jgi:hypothetical protein
VDTHPFEAKSGISEPAEKVPIAIVDTHPLEVQSGISEPAEEVPISISSPRS